MIDRRVGRAFACLVLSSVLHVAVTTQEAEDTLTVFVGEIQTFSPGFAMGNIVLADPAVAGYEPTASRREMLLRGKKTGTTTLGIWDQKGAQRRQITLHVVTREVAQAESDLRALLTGYPGVDVRRLGAGLIVVGTVGSRAELEAVERLASAAKVKSAVRTTLGGGVAVAGSAAAGAAPAAAASPAPGAAALSAPSSPASSTAPAVASIEYEVELFEASTQFRTGSYARGIEPSGRSLYRDRIRAPFGGETIAFIGGRAIAPQKPARSGKDGKPAPPDGAKQEPGAETGIRLTLQPSEPGQSGSFRTEVLVETNVPISTDLYDPDAWRRSRWSFTARPGEPFGIAGADLLASAGGASGSSIGNATRTAGTVARVPGVSGRPGVEYVPVFGSLFRSTSYSKKRTQLLVVLRPRVAAPPTQ